MQNELFKSEGELQKPKSKNPNQKIDSINLIDAETEALFIPDDDMRFGCAHFVYIEPPRCLDNRGSQMSPYSIMQTLQEEERSMHQSCRNARVLQMLDTYEKAGGIDSEYRKNEEIFGFISY